MPDGEKEPDPGVELEQLREALASRTEIGIALGMVMERFSVDREHAFALLSRISQNSNRNLRGVAPAVDAQREVPGLRVNSGRLVT